MVNPVSDVAEPHVVVYGPVVGRWYMTLRDGKTEAEPTAFSTADEAVAHGRDTYPSMPVRVLDLDALSLRAAESIPDGDRPAAGTSSGGTLTEFRYGSHAAVGTEGDPTLPADSASMRGTPEPIPHGNPLRHPYEIHPLGHLPARSGETGMYGVTADTRGPAGTLSRPDPGLEEDSSPLPQPTPTGAEVAKS